MSITDENNFETSDFYLAAFLITKSVKLKRINRSNPQRILFIFDDFEGRENLVRSFLYSEALVEPQLFIGAIKVLKQLIHYKND